MAEEEIAQEGAKQEQQQTDPFEAKAKEIGWNPDYEGDDKLTAKEFVQRAPLYDRLKAQHRKLKEQDKALHDMADTIQKVSEASYKKAIADLNSQKREAVEAADTNRVAEIDKQIDEIRDEMIPAKKDALHPAVEDWLSKKENAWFRDNPEMAAFASSYQNSLFSRNPNLDMEDSLAEVTKAVKKAFPDKFVNPNRQTASPVEGATVPNGTKKTHTFRDLNDEQRRVAERFERMGIMTRDDYVKQLADSGLIGG